MEQNIWGGEVFSLTFCWITQQCPQSSSSDLLIWLKLFKILHLAFPSGFKA
jgi:hypothetical protein